MTMSQRKTRVWFRQFKSDNFDLKDKERAQVNRKKFKDAELQALLNEDAAQTQKQLAEKLNVGEQSISD